MGEAKLNMAQQLRKSLGVPEVKNGAEEKHFQIQYGFSTEKMFISFGGIKVDNLSLSVEQADEMIKALQGLREAFVNREKGNG